MKAGPQIVPAKAKNLADSVERVLPSHLIENESLMKDFLEAYYEFLQDTRNVQFDIHNLLDYQDLDETRDEFLRYFTDEFLPSFPRITAANRRTIMKNAREFYRSRGSEKSFKMLFRMLFDQDVEIIYPKDQILRASDGIWESKTIMKVSSADINSKNLAGRRLFGTESGASTLVENVVQYFSGADLVTELTLSSVVGTFYIDEIVETRDPISITVPKIEARVFGIITNVIVVNGGTGYEQNETIFLSDNGDGRDFVAKIASVDENGTILKVDITNAGVGYLNTPPTVNHAQLEGTGAEFKFTIGAVQRTSGAFIGDQGKISSTPRLQDGRYYQDYSYVLKSVEAKQFWIDSVLKLLHPAGMFVTGIVDLLVSPDTFIDGRMLYHLSQPQGVNYSDPDHPSSRKFFELIININPDAIKYDIEAVVSIVDVLFPTTDVRAGFFADTEYLWRIQNMTLEQLNNNEAHMDNYERFYQYPFPYSTEMQITN